MYDVIAQNAYEHALSLIDEARSGSINKNGVTVERITWKELRKALDAYIKDAVQLDRGSATAIIASYPRILSAPPQGSSIQDALLNALAVEMMAPYRERLSDAVAEQHKGISTDEIIATFDDAVQIYNALPKRTIFADPKLDQRNILSLIDHLDGEVRDDDLRPQGKISHFCETAYSYSVDLENRLRDRTPEAKRHARRLLELGDFLRMCAENPALTAMIGPSKIFDRSAYNSSASARP